MGLCFAYHTNGFAHHRLDEALEIIAELGYQGVALTLDVHHLNPFETSPDEQRRAEERIAALGLSCVIETGARFLLDARRKHYPTLLSAQRERRLDFLRRAVDLAERFAARAGRALVSFWSGARPEDLPVERAWELLAEGVRALCAYAALADHEVRLAFEPEPGMFAATLADWEQLRDRVDHPALALTMDLGHVFLEGADGGEAIARYRRELAHVHIEDMRAGRHEHLMFGEGEMDFAPLLAALADLEFRGQVAVELSRHSHDAVAAARQALAFLRAHEPGAAAAAPLGRCP